MRVASRGALTGFLFGLVLFVFAFFSAGLGHGSYLQASLFAAPVSAVPIGALVIPVWWAALGWLLEAGHRRTAVAALAVHSLAAIAITLFGTPNEPASEQWRYFREMERVNPWSIWGGLALYAGGIVVAWSRALRRASSLARPNEPRRLRSPAARSSSD